MIMLFRLLRYQFQSVIIDNHCPSAQINVISIAELFRNKIKLYSRGNALTDSLQNLKC